MTAVVASGTDYSAPLTHRAVLAMSIFLAVSCIRMDMLALLGRNDG